MHVLREHNLLSYIYFMLHLKYKSESELSGVEKFVKHKTEEKDNCFFPINRSLALEVKSLRAARTENEIKHFYY